MSIIKSPHSVVVHDCSPSYPPMKRFVHGWYLLRDKVQIRGGHWNVQRAWYWTFIYIKYMIGLLPDDIL